MRPMLYRDAPVLRMLKRVLFAAAGLLLGGVVQAAGECQRTTVSALMSPDETWMAEVQEEVCSGPGFAVTGMTNIVVLMRRGEEPKRENDVFAFYAGPNKGPLIEWLSSEKLQIIIPNKSLVGLKKSSYANIEIIIKFNPDDPPERERWLRELGLAPK